MNVNFYDFLYPLLFFCIMLQNSSLLKLITLLWSTAIYKLDLQTFAKKFRPLHIFVDRQIA